MKTFVISDTHFGHWGVTKFTRADGSKLRPWTDPEAMTLDMVRWWNEIVGEKDKVYHLGDFAINRKWLYIQHQLNGRKVLIKGNHDVFRLSEYAAFEDIRACHVVADVLLTHIPVHPSSKGRFRANVHGHTHANVVTDKRGNPDPWYIPMSVEHWDYRPAELHRVLACVASV